MSRAASDDTTMAGQLAARLNDHGPSLHFEDRSWTWHQVIEESAARAGLIGELVDPDRPPHLGVLLANVPDYLFWLGGAALAGATVVGVNPTRRGPDLARDLGHTDCQVLVTDRDHADMLSADLAVPVLDIADQADRLDRHRHAGLPSSLPDPETNFLLMFTSGSTSAPKAVPCTNGRAGSAGIRVAAGFGIHADDVVYCPMPLFHGNALLACWSAAVAAGAPIVLRRRFSVSGFWTDVGRYRCTYFTYVGRTISYLLSRPASAEDGDNPLRIGFGTEAPASDRQAFAERFGTHLIEGYGSSESAIVINATADTPPGALGRPRPDQAEAIIVADPATGAECPRAVLDADGRLTNAAEAIGELVNRRGGESFTGYYNNPEASATRLRDGWFWSGDLAYRDVEGFFWFAGRTDDWMRVDSENLAAAPIAELLARLPGVAGAVVHAVPDERTGDQVMAVLEFAPGETFDPGRFARFLAEQPDLGTKWVPRYVRVVDSLPTTANHKVNTAALRRLGLDPADARLWWRPGRTIDYEPFGAADYENLLGCLAAHDRDHLLDPQPHQPTARTTTTC